MTRIQPTWMALKKYSCFVFIALLVFACQQEQDNKIDSDYLVDYTFKSVYSLSTIKALLSAQTLVYPDLSGIVDRAGYSVQVYIINYKTHYRDSVVVASGLVCLPMADEEFPVISFQNGTNTAHDNAPSVNPANANYLMLEFMASNGYIVLITDFIGFGASAELLHPYYHRTSSNNAVIDLIHAFNEMSQMDDIQAAGNNTVYLMGYSQGGWATLSALDEIQQHVPAIDIAAVSCGAGAYNLISMSSYVLDLETFPGPLYLPYFIYSQQVYGQLANPLSKFFQEPYAGKIPELFNGSLNNEEVNAQLTNSIPDLVTADLRNNFRTGTEFNELRELLNENSISGWNTTTRINLYHGTADLNVPPEQSASLYEELIHSGADPELVKYFELDGLTHATGLMPWGITTINWFNTLEDK